MKSRIVYLHSLILNHPKIQTLLQGSSSVISSRSLTMPHVNRQNVESGAVTET